MSREPEHVWIAYGKDRARLPIAVADTAAELAQRLHFTGREVCEIMGVPYADPDP